MKKFYILALAAMVFAACTTDDTQDLRPVDAPETLTVGFEGGNDDTRVQLNEAGKTVWTKDDLVSVFYRSDANQKWQFQGETGERLGNLKRVSAGSATETMKRVVVVYPYNENYYINTETYNIEATLPATQTYLKDSYGLDGNLMVSSDEFNQISLKSVYGWLKLQLTGNGERVQSITLKGNNGEQVAGLVYINSSNAAMTLAAEMGSADDPAIGGVGGNLIFDDTILTEVVLNCGNGVELGAEATAFYIALPPQTFEKGLTAEITTTDGKTMTKSTDKSLVIERNTIQPMASVTYNGIFKPANNEIYYTNGSTTEATSSYKTSVFGVNIVSNLYDADKKCWVITFDGDVTKIGDYAFYKCASLTSVTIPDSVTSIGDYAFSRCTSLTSVTIGNSVTKIGNYAFTDCDSLTNITIPDSVTSIGDSAFHKCTSLKAFYGKFASEDNRYLIVDGTLHSFAPAGITSYTIPDSVTSIGSYAFLGCTSLTSVTIPNSVTSIGYWAFGDCISLTSVTIPNSVTKIGNYAFTDCDSLTNITIPDSVTSIGESAFSHCDSLTSVNIPNSVTSIGEGAFRGCVSLKAFYGKFASEDNRCLIVNGTLNAFAIGCGATSYTIPNSVTSIGYWAFGGCSSLTSVTIPNSVTSIGSYAFAGCTSLISVTIGNGVTSIGSSAFSGCTSLTSVTIPDSVTSIGSGAFHYCTSLKSVTIGNGVTEIGNSAFSGCTSLTSVTIPDSVTSIGRGAFSGCTSLTNVTIGNGVTSIGERAFYYCNSLTSVTIGNGVTEIGNEAFRDCTSLKEVYCKRTTPPTGGSDMFYGNASGHRIFVPASDDDSIINAYKMAQYWSDYASSIFEYDFSAQQ